MNTEHLRYFLAVVQCGSIGKASERLQLKQQYLSSVIKSLEQQLGTQLFDRHTRGVSLTADGQYLHGKISQIVQLTDEIRLEYLYPSKSIYREAINDIEIYMVPQLRASSLSSVLADYRQHFPNVTIRLTEKSRPEILAALQDNTEALGVLLFQKSMEELRAALPPQLKAIYSRSTEMAVLLGDNHPLLENHSSVTHEELLQEQWVAYAPCGVEYSTVYRLLKPYGEPNIKYVVENSALLISLLQSGNYCSLGARDSAAAAGLKSLPFKEPLLLNLAFVLHEDMLKSFTIKSFINLLLTRSGQPVIQ